MSGNKILLHNKNTTRLNRLAFLGYKWETFKLKLQRVMEFLYGGPINIKIWKVESFNVNAS